MNAPIRTSAFLQNVAEITDVSEVDLNTGLDVDEVGKRRERHGANRMRLETLKSALPVLLDQYKGVIVWLLAAAAVFSLYLVDVVEALAILVVLLINGAIGFITELRTIRSMEASR